MENRIPLPGRLPVISGKVVAVVLVAALVVSGVVVYRNRAASQAAATSYTTSAVQRGTITDAVTGTGPISAAKAVPLNFKSSGKVAEIDVKVGDQVSAGDVLAKLDDTDLRSQLQQAQASLASAQAAYDKLMQGALPTDVAAAQTAIDSANTQVANARKALAGAQDTATKDLASAQQAVSSAQQSQADAQKNLQAAQAQIDAATASDKVTLANAQQALADAQKTAQALPAIVAQQIEQAKDKLYADQIADDAAVGRGAMTSDARQAALDVDQTAITQANASAQQQLAQSQQTLNQAQATLNNANATLQNDLAKFQGQLVSAQTQANSADQALKTAQTNLASAQAKDNQSVQSAQAQVDSAVSSVQTAQAAYNQKVAPPSQPDIDAAKAQVTQQTAATQLAQNNLDAAVLKAPTDGTVTAVNGAVGQWLSGGATSGASASSASGANTTSTSTDFVDLTSLSGLQVTAQVNEADISRVKVGQPITFTVDANPGRTFTGKVIIIQPLGQTSQNVVSYTVTSSVDQTNATLLPGMTATINIIVNQVNNALEVPMSALTFARTQTSASRTSGQQGTSPAGQSAQASAAPAQASGQAQASANPNQTGGQAGGQARAQGGGQARAQGNGQAGLFQQPGGPGILYLMKDGKPTPVQVMFGPSDGRFVQVVSGVNEGDQVITGGGGAGQAQAGQQQRGPAGAFGFGPGR